MDHDDRCRDIVSENPNMLIPWYLITSVLYYEKDISIISDELYDLICEIIDEEWDNLEHRHKEVIDRSALSAGTGYYLQIEEIPRIVLGAANDLVGEVVF